MHRYSKRLLIALMCCLPAAAQITGANGIKKGAWKSSDVPKGWTVLSQGQYDFQSNTDAGRVKKVANHLNAMFKLYMLTFPTGRTPTQTFVVKIFKNRQEFLDYGAPPFAGAYYSKEDREMVGYDTGMIDGDLTGPSKTGKTARPGAEDLKKLHTMDMLGVFAHEGWHQFFHWWCPSQVPFPSWCDEGIGEYFYTARVRQGKTVTGDPNTYRLSTIQYAIKAGRHIPLKDIVTFDQAKYYAVADLAYAEGWSFCHFLQECPEYKKQKYLAKYVTSFGDHHSIKRAVEDTFTHMDWPKTEAAWKAWVMAIKNPEAELAAAAEAAFKRDLEKFLGKNGDPESRPESGPASRPESQPGSQPESLPEGGVAPATRPALPPMPPDDPDEGG